MTNARTGASVRNTINDCPAAVAVTLGFTPEEAHRMIRTRHVLPVLEDSKTPAINARKLWERIGKPHKRFRDWADFYIKPRLTNLELSAEISALKVQARGTPRTDYVLSRDLAAELAMMANTPEGRDVRRYFLDMERLALRLSEHVFLRESIILDIDNAATHLFRKRTGDEVKSGVLSKSEAAAKALEQEKALKSLACEVVTGVSPRAWRNKHAGGIRKALHTADLYAYHRAYDHALLLAESGNNREAVRKILSKRFANKIDPLKYGVSQTEF